MSENDNKKVYQGNLISLYKEKVPLHNIAEGEPRHTYFDIVKHPGGAVIAAINSDNEICLLKQWRQVGEQWRDLGKIIPSPGFSNEVLYLYEARDLSPGTVKLDAAEKLEAHWIDLEEVKKMAKSGAIVDAKTLALLLRL